jgi:hypothetical protein
MARPDGLIELPNGEAIFYADAQHAYYRARYDGQGWVRSTRLTGASTLSKPFSFDSGRLLAWKERMTCEGVASVHARNLEWMRNGGYDEWLDWLNSSDSIRAALKEASLLADDARDRKATIGTNVHSVLEGLAGVCPMPNVDELPDEEKGYARAVMRWWEERRPEVLNAEQFVYSAEHGYAGRFDLRYADHIAEMTFLLDLKTSGFISPAHHVQLALYELAAKECGVGDSDVQIILKVKEDGTWQEIPCKATEADARAAIAVYRGAGRIERQAA